MSLAMKTSSIEALSLGRRLDRRIATLQGNGKNGVRRLTDKVWSQTESVGQLIRKWQFVIELASATDRTRLPGERPMPRISFVHARCSASQFGAWRSNNLCQIRQHCPHCQTLHQKNLQVGVVPSRTRAIERSVEGCTRCAHADRLLD